LDDNTLENAARDTLLALLARASEEASGTLPIDSTLPLLINAVEGVRQGIVYDRRMVEQNEITKEIMKNNE
jgi:hypothetical protein